MNNEEIKPKKNIVDRTWYTTDDLVDILGLSKSTVIGRRKHNPSRWGFRLVRKTVLVWAVNGKNVKKSWLQHYKPGRPIAK